MKTFLSFFYSVYFCLLCHTSVDIVSVEVRGSFHTILVNVNRSIEAIFAYVNKWVEN